MNRHTLTETENDMTDSTDSGEWISLKALSNAHGRSFAESLEHFTRYANGAEIGIRRAVAADLVREGPIERFPDPWPVIHLLGYDVPLMRLFPFEDSAPAKLIAALLLAALPSIK